MISEKSRVYERQNSGIYLLTPSPALIFHISADVKQQILKKIQQNSFNPISDNLEIL
jgi:hypothetical protein